MGNLPEDLPQAIAAIAAISGQTQTNHDHGHANHVIGLPHIGALPQAHHADQAAARGLAKDKWAPWEGKCHAASTGDTGS